MPAPHALCSKMLAERTASRNVFVLFYFIYLCPLFSKKHARSVGYIPPLVTNYVAVEAASL
jgi:hypothetical protein